MTGATTTSSPERVSTRVVADGSLWSEPSSVSGTRAPDVAVSAQAVDLVTDVHATISTTACTTSNRSVQLGEIVHYQCDPTAWVDVTTDFAFQGPGSLEPGGVLTVSVAGDGRNEYWAEVVSIDGGAAGKLSVPDAHASKRRWSVSWTVTDRLEPGDDVSVTWRMSGAEAVDPSRGSHVDATFLYPAGHYSGSEEREIHWIGSPANTTGASSAAYPTPTRFFGFVSES